MRIKANDLSSTQGCARKQAQTFIIGLAVGRVKPAEEENGPIWLKLQSRCAKAATLCLFRKSGLI
jgi:hypothetical protein